MINGVNCNAVKMRATRIYFFTLLNLFLGACLVLGQAVPKLCPNQEAILPCRCLLRDKEYQIWCSHSDLPRVLEGLKALSQFVTHPIDELILESNNLPSLPGKSFMPLKVMRLMLRYNNLERVSNGWLNGLEDSLMELFIVEPELRSLPEESLLNQNQLEAVTLQSNTMKRLPQFSNLPKLRYVKAEGSNIIELSPRHFNKLPSLEKVHISGSPRLDRLEAGLFQDLPRLTFVNISYCGVAWMHLRSFSQLPALKELSLEGNRIVDASVVGRAARDLPALEVLKLDFNLINKLGDAAFVDLPSLKKLTLSNNEITELLKGAFHRVPELRTLDLNNNRLKRVHTEVFHQRSGTGIEELLLINNDISHVAELSALLESLPSLTFLDMSYNNLEAIPFGTLHGHATLEYLRLDFNKLHIIDREAFQGMPALRELRLKNNSLSDRLEAPFWNLPSLKGLDLSGNYFRRLTPRLLSNVPELRKIDLSSNRINFVDQTAFLMTPNLEHVNLSQNALVTLHPATFRHLLNLYELDVSSNDLLEFVPGLPRGLEYLFISQNSITNIPMQPSPDLDLPQLKMLDLSGNTIQRISQSAFRTFPQLRKLHLGRNALHGLEEGSLGGLAKLEFLDLSANRISKFNPNVLKENHDLTDLNLRGNRIDILVADAFSGAENIRRLDLSRNQLTEIISGTLEGNRNLEEIDASHNSLVHLPPGLYGMKKLRKLDVTDNRLNMIHPDVLNSLTSLEELKLSHNFIQQIRRGAFDSLLNLRVLELDNNELQDVESKAIHALPQLKSLKLGRNKLQEIPNAAFSNLPSLQTAELQENELRLIGSNAFHHVPHLLMLNISRNLFSGLEDAGLRSLRSLEMLDLSSNQLNQVSSPSLARMEWLVELRMDNNKICSVQGATFNGMPRLRVLSFRNNRMMSFPEHVIQKLRGNIAVLDIEGNPLACSCSLLWMKGWLQEQQLMGPKCMDGSLLREVRLSRQECQAEERHNDPVAPGCESEMLSAPGGFGSPQSLIQSWQDVKEDNRSKQHLVKNHLAPSPEESDYFYDDYVDYPYNDTLLKNGPKPSVTFGRANLTNAASKPNSAHFIPGDTPVLYAASKNRTKPPDTPKGVVGSPSSSGFTFFGLPLPSLNLNNLLGTGSMRVDKGKMAQTLIKPPELSVGANFAPNAERKAAIVNKPASHRNPSIEVQKSILPPPRDIPERHNIIGMMPPVHPQILSGGFIPLMPGTHGFTPIIPLLGIDTDKPHTALNDTFAIGSVEKVNITRLEENIPNGQIDPTNQPQSSQSFLSKRGPSTSPPILTSYTTIEAITSEQSTLKNVRVTSSLETHTHRNHTSATTEIMNTQEEEIDDETENPQEEYESESNYDPVSEGEESRGDSNLQRVQVMINETSPKGSEGSLDGIQRPQINDNFDDIFKEVVDVPILVAPNTQNPTHTTSRILLNATSMNILPTVNPQTEADISVSSSSSIDKNLIGTPLSAILVPGGQITHLKPTGSRHASITKVTHPTSSSSIQSYPDLELSSSVGKFEFDDIDVKDELAPMAHNRETWPKKKNENEGTTEDLNWYFANYNKSGNLEPFIGGGMYASSGSGSAFNCAICKEWFMAMAWILLVN